MYSKLEQYIFFALKKHRQIHLPGYGVLEIVTKDAESHPVHHEYEAPAEFIQFSENAAHGKNLAEILATDASLKKSMAEKIINDFFETFSQKLNSENKAELEGIGAFYLKGKTLEFRAEPNAELLQVYYGLFNFKAGTPKKAKQDHIPVAKKKKKRKIPAIVFIILFFGAAITAAFFIFPEQSNEIWNKAISVFDKNDENRTPIENNTNSTPNDTVAIANIDSTMADSSNADTADIDITQNANENSGSNIENNTVSSGPKYYVVAGCFQMKELADNLVSKLKNQNYPALIIGTTPEGLHIVSFNKGYSSKDEALQMLNQIQSRDGRNDLWIHYGN